MKLKRRGTAVVKALFSIKPSFARLILSGDKRCEYRRKLPARPISDIVIYATSPVSRIIGEVKVDSMVLLEKERLWQQTCSYGGISRGGFESYFCGTEMAGALLLSNPVTYDRPLLIEEVGVSRPPQSFCYLGENDE